MGVALRGSGRSSPSRIQKKYLRWSLRNRAMSTPFTFHPAFRRLSGGRPLYRPSWALIIYCCTSLVIALGVPRRGYPRADGPYTLASGTRLYVRLESEV